MAIRWRLPDFPRKSKTISSPATCTWRLRSVVAPKDPLSRRYRSPPTRMNVRSISCTTAASTRSLDALGGVVRRRRAESAVVAPVPLSADTNECAVHQLHDRREHPLLGELRVRKIRRDAAPDPRKREREVVQRVELVRVALGDPHRVIAVLLAPAGIPSRRLQVAVRIRAYPDVLPGGRYREAADALERLAAADQTSARAAIGKSFGRR